MKKLYLGIPYSHSDPKVRKDRFLAANWKAAKLMLEGYIVFSPVSMCHPISLCIKDSANDGSFWLRQVIPWLEGCDVLGVYCLPGWRESKGLNAEIGIAMTLRKEILFFEPEKLLGKLED